MTSSARKEQMKLYARRNRERMNETRRVWRDDNRDRVNEVDRAYRRRNRQKVRAQKLASYHRCKNSLSQVVQQSAASALPAVVNVQQAFNNIPDAAGDISQWIANFHWDKNDV